MLGTIFYIEEFTLHGGPRIRTTVFLKGCPLRCRWCHNPEGLSFSPEVMKKHNLCTGCNMCQKHCEHEDCKPFPVCVLACPNGALHIAGQRYSAEELANRLLENKEILKAGSGGVTFSGGEPLAQAEFMLEVISKLNGMHTAIQTSGYADQDVFKRVINKVDYVMFDIKLADPVKHKQYTGVSNELILKNFEILRKSNKDYIVTTPLIPNITDTQENLRAIKALIKDSKWQKLPYNPYTAAKYRMLNREYKL